MKKVLIILISCLFLFGCKSSNTLYGVLDKSDFTETEKMDIVKLVDFFESQIQVEGKTRRESYEMLLIDFDTSYSYALSKKIEIEKQRKLFENINESTYNEVWYESKGTAYKSYEGKDFREPISFKSLSANAQGKYAKYLQKIGRKNKVVKKYVEKLQASGDFPIGFSFWWILTNLDENQVENFEKSYWRIIISIHLSSINESENRYQELSDEK